MTKRLFKHGDQQYDLVVTGEPFPNGWFDWWDLNITEEHQIVEAVYPVITFKLTKEQETDMLSHFKYFLND